MCVLTFTYLDADASSRDLPGNILEMKFKLAFVLQYLFLHWVFFFMSSVSASYFFPSFGFFLPSFFLSAYFHEIFLKKNLWWFFLKKIFKIIYLHQSTVENPWKRKKKKKSDFRQAKDIVFNSLTKGATYSLSLAQCENFSLAKSRLPGNTKINFENHYFPGVIVVLFNEINFEIKLGE